MPYPVSKRKKLSVSFHDELNLIPVLNVFLILIPFIMVTVVLSRLVSHDIRLPDKDKKPTKRAVKQMTMEIQPDSLIINLNKKRINAYSFEFKHFIESNFSTEDSSKTVLEDSLKIIIEELQKNYLNEGYDKFLLAPADEIPYKIIIFLMDRCKLFGIKKISISYLNKG